MSVDTPVLERRTSELTGVNNRPYAVPTRSASVAEDEHNARIRDNYARLINPNNKIEDIFNNSTVLAQPVQEVQPVQIAQPVITAQPVQTAQPAQAEIYRVENARADAAIFRADNPINQRFLANTTVVNEASEEEENEDLRPTPATIQYRTIDSATTEVESKESERFVLSKKQKTAIIVLAAVIVSLIALIIINSTVIANLNTDIAQLNSNIANINAEIQYSVSQITDKISKAQTSIDTLRGATAGITGSLGDVIHGFIG